jgi:hypothetical protein
MIPRPLYRSMQMNAARRHANRWPGSVGVFPLALKTAERFVCGTHAPLSSAGTQHRLCWGSTSGNCTPFPKWPRWGCDLVIDIGSAEGYFAVELAQSGKRMIAFDADPDERKTWQELSRLKRKC